MKLSSNFICFHNEFGLRRTIDIFADAGFEGIDFNVDLEEYYTDTHDESFYRATREYAISKGIVFSQTHAPFPSSFPDAEKTALRFEQIVRGLQHSAWLGAEMVVVHPCAHLKNRDENMGSAMLEYNLDFYSRLIPHAEALGVKIAIENIPSTVTETPEGLLSLIQALGSDVFTVCFDVGHANISGQNPADSIRALGSVIGCTHIHDNTGTADAHTLPYYGSICWEEVMQAFSETGYAGNLSYEAGYFVRNVPVRLRPVAAAYMAQTGRHLISLYGQYQQTT